MTVAAGERVYKDRMYQCGVELPALMEILPYSAATSYWTRIDKSFVTPNDTHDCNFFEKKTNDRLQALPQA
jgi:hypothetical protein